MPLCPSRTGVLSVAKNEAPGADISHKYASAWASRLAKDVARKAVAGRFAFNPGTPFSLPSTASNTYARSAFQSRARERGVPETFISAYLASYDYVYPLGLHEVVDLLGVWMKNKRGDFSIIGDPNDPRAPLFTLEILSKAHKHNSRETKKSHGGSNKGDSDSNDGDNVSIANDGHADNAHTGVAMVFPPSNHKSGLRKLIEERYRLVHGRGSDDPVPYPCCTRSSKELEIWRGKME